MKLQAAIDRVSLDQAVYLAHALDGVVDIVELGTSIPKDFGLKTLNERGVALTQSELLIDLKTIDEGVYEFTKGFELPADILTVMASASIDTIEQVYALSEKLGRQTFIDLLEVSDDQIARLTHLNHAIFGLHHSKDTGGNFDAVASVAQFHAAFPNVEHIAVAGGINVSQAAKLAEQGIVEIAIVGGKIAGADDPVAAAKEFMEVIK
ncbi:orotidine 5'-phosphate decarboxylase / HUMPS family protein [Furfurilactobacillus curtus]|uniref:3-hexulose-6-phosphate synthase n=1 Tax=Furfurilactobacillus curtus TaxID=1746200 RepID=A0ABQ5JMJ5_9LACO